jgi:hypothetical protein
MKTPQEFDFARNPKTSAQPVHELGERGYTSGAPKRNIFAGNRGTDL